MSLGFLQKNPLTRRLLLHAASGRAQETVGHFGHLLSPGEHILDVGAGLCDITHILQQQGHIVTALDVRNFSCIPHITPTIYEGQTMPFADKSFATALLLTVLHHTPHPERMLQEALRVAHRVIVIEDVTTNSVHKYATYCLDSLLNLEFVGHPHSNKTDAQWQTLFQKRGLNITAEKSMQSFGVLRHRMYVLVPEGPAK